jgi:hypothetical protein
VKSILLQLIQVAAGLSIPIEQRIDIGVVTSDAFSGEPRRLIGKHPARTAVIVQAASSSGGFS